jgi:hypothetical protein
MVDVIRRKLLAEELRHFVAGQMTNDEFEDRAFEIIKGSRDIALWEIMKEAGCLSDDTHNHRLRGRHAIGKDGRHQISRWIVFLYSNLEYEWPQSKICWGSMIIGFVFQLGVLLSACMFVIFCMLFMITLFDYFRVPNYLAWVVGIFFILSMIAAGLIVCQIFRAYGNHCFKRQKEKMKRHGNPDIWPFLRDGDFDHIKAQPKLL